MTHKSIVYDDVFTVEEIDQLREFYDAQPVAYTNESTGNQAKNLDYHIPGSTAFRIVRPKLNKLLGNDHNFLIGAYHECHSPFQTHIDNAKYTEQWNSFNVQRKHERLFLIPLMEGPNLNTIMFDQFSEEDVGMGQLLPQEWTKEANDLDLNELTHIDKAARDQLQYIPVDQVINWKKGRMFSWNINQLHASTNFKQHGIDIKKYILIGIA